MSDLMYLFILLAINYLIMFALFLWTMVRFNHLEAWCAALGEKANDQSEDIEDLEVRSRHYRDVLDIHAKSISNLNGYVLPTVRKERNRERE